MNENNLFPLSQSWSDFPVLIDQELAILKTDSVIMEIGGGANPYLDQQRVKNYRYIVVDIDEKELIKAKGDYFERICTDVTKDNKGIKCDIIITNMLLEHITNPRDFHEACFEMLNDQGKAIHFFATKFSPASIINVLLPESWSRQLLYAIQKRKWETEGKFPAYYKWCMGPTKKQLFQFQSLGYKIELYNGYLGSGYLKNLIFLRFFEQVFNKIILKWKNPNFCSNSISILKKIK